MLLLRRAISFFRVPLTRKHLTREREYEYKDIQVSILPGVFHPGLFPSTKMLLAYLAEQQLTKKMLLELGCGSGLISIAAEKAGATVTSSDISGKAIENIKRNAIRNQSTISIIHSDLFERIPPQVFDWIVINPPYYRKTPRDEAEAAWYCGSEFEYFKKLFPALKNFISQRSTILMTLAEACDIVSITGIAAESGFRFDRLAERNSWLEGRDFLFQIIPD